MPTHLTLSQSEGKGEIGVICLPVYLFRLQGEAKVTSLIRRVQEYLEDKYGKSEPELLCRIYMRRIDHLYYKVGRGRGRERESK